MRAPSPVGQGQDEVPGQDKPAPGAEGRVVIEGVVLHRHVRFVADVADRGGTAVAGAVPHVPDGYHTGF